MPKLFVGNFDFEHELAGESKPTKPVDAVLRDLAACWVGLAEPDDLVLADRNHELPFIDERRIDKLTNRSDFVLAPWGWTQSIHDWGHQHGLKVDHAEFDVIQRASSRAYSFQLEQEFDTILPLSRSINDASQVHDALTEILTNHRQWVIKANWGMSARERLVGRKANLEDNQLRWLNKRLRHDRPAFLEPWVESLEELSFQWQIDRAGNVNYLGSTKLLSDPLGGYVGSRILDKHSEDWDSAFSTIEQTVHQLAHEGYFGPLGIDAMKYLDNSGHQRFRPLQDINARFTMGRMAVAMKRFLEPGETGTWFHIRGNKRSNRTAAELVRMLPEKLCSVRVLSPMQFDTKAHRIPVLIAANSMSDIERVESNVLELMFEPGN